MFDHTSVAQFIEQRFAVVEPNISPWRRTVAGDLSSLFNFANPNRQGHIHLPDTSGFLPSIAELAGGGGTDFVPDLGSVILGVPQQETGVRPGRALPYELNVHATVNGSTVTLTFLNTGGAGAVFHVRSLNPADNVRTYTVEPGKQLADTWNAASTYALSVYGPNGFVRFFKGSVGAGAALLDLVSKYDLREDSGSIELTVTNLSASADDVTMLDAYRGETRTRHVLPGHSLENEVVLEDFGGWYDLIPDRCRRSDVQLSASGTRRDGTRQHFRSGSRGCG